MGIIKLTKSMRSHLCITASLFGGHKKCSNYGETEYSLIVIGHHNTCGTARAVDYTQQDAWKKQLWLLQYQTCHLCTF